MTIKAVLFDLHNTLVYNENPVSAEEISRLLFSKGYEVSPQQLKASWMFVSFVDYPKYGYKSWNSYLSRIFQRLKAKVDKETLGDIVNLLEANPYKLYSDAEEAVVKAKKSRFKTAIVTTIAYFQFKEVIKPIREYFDFIMTGYEAGCDKTNLKMYRKILETLKVKPNEAVMIGDDVQVDILLPKRLGINAILLDRKGQNPKCQAANAIVNDLQEALEVILKFQVR
ncbi:MAG: HAD family hydrolase [Candidatus Bathyarchaeia archaeon]